MCFSFCGKPKKNYCYFTAAARDVAAANAAAYVAAIAAAKFSLKALTRIKHYTF